MPSGAAAESQRGTDETTEAPSVNALTMEVDGLSIITSAKALEKHAVKR